MILFWFGFWTAWIQIVPFNFLSLRFFLFFGDNPFVKRAFYIKLLFIVDSFECDQKWIHLFQNKTNNQIQWNKEKNKRLRLHFQLVPINLIDEVIAQWPLSLLKITKSPNKKKTLRKKTQNRLQQQIINFCLPFGQFVMCAFDSQHVKLCSLLLCEIFSVCFVHIFGVHVALHRITVVVTAACCRCYCKALIRFHSFDCCCSPGYLRSAISIAYIFLSVSPFIYLVVGAYSIRCSRSSLSVVHLFTQCELFVAFYACACVLSLLKCSS